MARRAPLRCSVIPVRYKYCSAMKCFPVPYSSSNGLHVSGRALCSYYRPAAPRLGVGAGARTVPQVCLVELLMTAVVHGSWRLGSTWQPGKVLQQQKYPFSSTRLTTQSPNLNTALSARPVTHPQDEALAELGVLGLHGPRGSLRSLGRGGPPGRYTFTSRLVKFRNSPGTCTVTLQDKSTTYVVKHRDSIIFDIGPPPH
ncbi:hypothetical protein NDU88_002351 [Pleurodeles waltl]|uniref:Uncharacterized protein n=1 Tax=Pleurodeles waltl TaxID=8319 RepID=A0AAV7T2K9_PLEWA|nr:hypothetical protein NDU88_002351 [Pleurodeles waltl]